jgi:hypothetical protein
MPSVQRLIGRITKFDNGYVPGGKKNLPVGAAEVSFLFQKRRVSLMLPPRIKAVPGGVVVPYRGAALPRVTSHRSRVTGRWPMLGLWVRLYACAKIHDVIIALAFLRMSRVFCRFGGIYLLQADSNQLSEKQGQRRLSLFGMSVKRHILRCVKDQILGCMCIGANAEFHLLCHVNT